jgi:TolB protein
VVTLDGALVRELDVQHPRIDDPSLSPDGRTVVFWASSSTAVDGGSLYTMPVSGSEVPKSLTKAGIDTDADPSWSPDGSQIAFRRRTDDGTKNGNFDVYLINAKSSELTPLVRSPALDEKPTWSPDGDELVVVSNRTSRKGHAGKAYDLWVIRRDGKIVRRLHLNARDMTTPAWGQR